jgi:hypothetical protein
MSTAPGLETVHGEMGAPVVASMTRRPSSGKDSTAVSAVAQSPL